MADGISVRRVADIVNADPARRFLVVSAPGKRFGQDTKVTDLLYETYEELQVTGKLGAAFTKVCDRFRSLVSELGISFDIGALLHDTEREIYGEPTKDFIASRGEYLNGIIMAKYLGFSFVDAAEVIRFKADGEHDAERTNTLMRDRLSTVESAVIPGFYGAYEDGRVKTFSRGGSDITGSIVARAIKANVYENWTDVSGVLVADPRIIYKPEGVETITYRELRELAYMGFSVLHEDAIFPVRSEGIPINIRNTNAPDDNGTWIVESTCQKSKYVITGIAGKKGFCAVNIEKEMMNSEIGFGRKVLQAFEENEISFEHVPSGIDTMTVFVHQDEFMHKEQKVVSGIHRLADPDSIDIEADLALIAVVGRGMKSTRGTAGRIFSALAHANVNVKMIDQGSSELNIIIGVANADFETAIKAIYDIFVISQI